MKCIENVIEFIESDINLIEEKLPKMNREKSEGRKEWHEGYLTAMREVKNKLDQLDEPEVLSQEFIDKYTWNNHYIGRPFVYVDDLQNLLVPKQDEVVSKTDELKPTIPQFVADWYENHRDNLEKQLQGIAYNLDRYGRMPEVSDLDKWINETEYPLQILASLRLGYEVEEEQKYYVIFPTQVNQAFGGFNLAEENFNYLATDGSDYWIEDTRSDDLSWEERSTFTEQEIKDYDERFWTFAVKVEEEE